MSNLKKYLKARMRAIKRDLDSGSEEYALRNMQTCYELAAIRMWLSLENYTISIWSCFTNLEFVEMN